MYRKTVSVLLFLFFSQLFLFAIKNPVVRKQFPTGGRITAVAYDRRKRILYTVSQDRYLYALSETYLLKWRLWLKDPSISSLTVGPDHTIYTGTEYNKLIAVNPSGRIIWELKLDGKPVGNVVCDPDGTLYTVTGAGSLYAVSHTGMIRYRIQLPSKPVLSPVMNDRYIFVACRDNRLYAYDRWGTQKWIFLFSGIPLSVVCSDSYIYAGTGTGTVVAVDMEGRKKWNSILHNPVSSIVLLSKDSLFCSSSGSLVSLNTSGKIRWIFEGRRKLVSLALLGEWLVAADNTGNIIYLDFSGILSGSIRIGKASSPINSSAGGEILIGSKDWNIYVLAFKEMVVAQHKNYIWPLTNGFSEGNRINKDVSGRLSFDKIDDPSNDFNYLKSLADSNNLAAASTVISTIGKRIESERYDRGKAFFLPMLEYLASDCITRPYYKNRLLINDFSVLRSRADELLGRVGDFKTQKILLNLLNYEWDDYAVRTIISSAGKLGHNPENKTVLAFSNYYLKNRHTLDGENLRLSILEALDNIYRYNGILDSDSIHLILSVFNDSSSKQVRKYALALINSLKN